MSYTRNLSTSKNTAPRATVDATTLAHVERYNNGWVLVKGKLLKEGGQIVTTCESQQSAMTEMRDYNEQHR